MLGTCLTWPVLLPVNYYGNGDGKQLDRLSFSNINRNDILWAHVAVAWLFFGTVTLLIVRERLRLIGARQAVQLDKANAARLSTRVVLYLNVPRHDLDTTNIEATFGAQATKSWTADNVDELQRLVDRRKEVALGLETAQVSLAKGANHEVLSQHSRRLHGTQVPNIELEYNRPKHRLLPVLGAKVDTIDWSRNTIRDLNEQIKTLQVQQTGRIALPDQSAVFVAYATQAAAHRAYQTHHFKPRLPLSQRFLDVRPKEVLWSAIVWSPGSRATRASLALVFIIVFTIFFSIPAGLIGTLSNVSYLSKHVEWLQWLDRLPNVVLALLQGLLPSFLVSWFVSYVPKLFRHVAKLSGEPTIPQAELKVQAWFFLFSVIQVFLVTTVSSGAAAVAYDIIKDPASAPTLLASSLPTASNFYMTYFILQGTASAADNILSYSDVFEYLFLERFCTSTPRDKYELYVDMNGISYGKLYPKFTNLLVIALAYACIAPLVVGFAAVGLALYYLCYRYQFLYVCQSKIDSRGRMYKRALGQMMTGVYLAELCLLGLLGARKGSGQAAMIAVLLVFTAIVHGVTDQALQPLELFLGKDVHEAQEAPLLANQDGIDSDDDEEVQAASHPHRLGLQLLPQSASSRISRYFETVIASSRKDIKNHVQDNEATRELPVLTEKELETAYLNPALTFKPPTLWLARDEAGVSSKEVEMNKDIGLPTSDEGAAFDLHNKIVWSKEDFAVIPLFKAPVTNPSI